MSEETIRFGTFEPEDLEKLNRAFETVWFGMIERGCCHPEDPLARTHQSIIAKAVVEVAKSGEIDPVNIAAIAGRRAALLISPPLSH